MKNLAMTISRVLISLLIAATSGTAAADCFDDAATAYRVNPWILRAIAFQESRFKPNTINHNTDGSVDVGMMGTNSVHFPELRRIGVTPAALYDPCTAIYVAARDLSMKMRRYGNTWRAVGTYHSKTPHLRDAYAERIRRTVDGWKRAGYIP